MKTDQVEVVINGGMQNKWSSYEIDSNLLTPADEWRVSLMQEDMTSAVALRPGDPIQVRMSGDMVLVGQLDETDDNVQKSGRSLSLVGRDQTAVLMDCSAPVFSFENLTLEQVVAKIVRPMGITRIRVDAPTQLMRERVSTEPGDSGWQALQRAAEANGLWPWFDPSGMLIVGGPDYNQAPVDKLALRTDGSGNVRSVRKRDSIAPRHSEVTVLGQSSGTAQAEARINVRATVKDEGVRGYRPLIVVDHEATNEAIASARARKIIGDGRVKGFQLQVNVSGHRTSGGVLWTPGQRVALVSEPHGIDGIFFLMARRFVCSRTQAPNTVLTLHEDRAWIVNAHPHHRKHGRGKNAGAGRIVDLSGGAE